MPVYIESQNLSKKHPTRKFWADIFLAIKASINEREIELLSPDSLPITWCYGFFFLLCGFFCFYFFLFPACLWLFSGIFRAFVYQIVYPEKFLSGLSPPVIGEKIKSYIKYCSKSFAISFSARWKYTQHHERKFNGLCANSTAPTQTRRCSLFSKKQNSAFSLF